MEHARGPSPDNPDENLGEIMDKITRIASEAAARATVNVQGYRESRDDSWQRWILGICAGAVLAGIVGGVVMYGKLAAYDQRFSNIEQQLQDLKRLVEPRYRGGPTP